MRYRGKEAIGVLLPALAGTALAFLAAPVAPAVPTAPAALAKGSVPAASAISAAPPVAAAPVAPGGAPGSAIPVPDLPPGIPPAPATPARPAEIRLPPAVDAPTADRAEKLVQEGIALYEDGDFRGAIAILTQATRLDGRNARGLYYLANAYWRLDDLGRASDAFTRLLALDPKGPFAEDASAWLGARGNFEVLAARIQIAPAPGQPAKPSSPSSVTMQDGWTRIDPPAGWVKASDEEVKVPGGGEYFHLSFRKDLGEGRAAHLVAEAHHAAGKASPSPARRGVPGLTEIADRILGELGISEYQITRSKGLEGGQEYDFDAPAAAGGPMQGTVRGTWAGASLLVAVATAPRAAWPGLAKPLQAAASTLRTAPASERRVDASREISGGPSPSPGPSPTPDVPTFFMPRPGEPTLPPGLYPAPWSTPHPRPTRL